jgi:NADH:ubiquinone oxidoreductase subunit 3 (subunit A)
MDMPAGYEYVAAFVIVGVLFLAVTFGLGRLVRPSRYDPSKLLPYECGPDPFMPAWHQFNIRYYIYALLFVLFDVEVAFLFPWALAYRRLGWAGVIEMVVFVAILTLGLIYAWRKGALEWQ